MLFLPTFLSLCRSFSIFLALSSFLILSRPSVTVFSFSPLQAGRCRSRGRASKGVAIQAARRCADPTGKQTMSLEKSTEGRKSNPRLFSQHNGSYLDIRDSSQNQDMSSRSELAGWGRNVSKRRQRAMGFNTRNGLISILAMTPAVMAQNCVSISGSKQCPAFDSASISTTDRTLIGYLYVLPCSKH